MDQVQFRAAMRWAEDSLAAIGRADFEQPSLADSDRMMAEDVVRYAAWRARQLTGCKVRVLRHWCPACGFLASVRTTFIPAEPSSEK